MRMHPRFDVGETACKVCGERPTVRSHLFPRALLLDIRGDEKHLLEGSRHSNGIVFRQNGPWDDTILCEAHERLLNRADTYAVNFHRRFADLAKPSRHKGALEVANPSPTLLAQFAYSIVWRTVVSASGKKSKLSLGPYEPVLRNAVFNDGAYELNFFVSKMNLRSGDGKPAPMCIAPYPQNVAGLRVWHFLCGELAFYLKTDKRPLPPGWNLIVANDRNPILVSELDPLDLRNVKLISGIVARMQVPAPKTPR